MKLFNIKMPVCWIETLRQKARLESVRRKSNVSISLLIREVIQEKYKLRGENAKE